MDWVSKSHSKQVLNTFPTLGKPVQNAARLKQAYLTTTMIKMDQLRGRKPRFLVWLMGSTSENQNVFQRATSAEGLKARQLTEIDSQIAQLFSTLGTFGGLNVPAPNLPGLQQVIQQAQQLAPVNNQLQVVINGAQDTEAVRQAVERAFTGFYRKNFGATALA